MAAKKQAKTQAVKNDWYVVGQAPECEYLAVGEELPGLDMAIADAREQVSNKEGEAAVCVYRLVPVKIVRRAGVIVEDVS